MSRAVEGASGRPPGVASLPLQFCQASSGAEIRTRSRDTGRTGWVDQEAADVKGDLFFEDGFFDIGQVLFISSTISVILDDTVMPLTA